MSSKFVVLVAVAALGACTTMGGSLQTPASGGARALPQSVPSQTTPGQMLSSLYRRLGARIDVNGHPDHSQSWMSSDAKRKALLYAGDEDTDDIYVFSYPQGKLEGTLTGVGTAPFGECTDRAGDVWITDFDSQIVEYAHGGTTIIATLNDPGQETFGCAVDPKSGDLAVASFGTTSGGPGSINVYARAKGTPKVYTDPNSANEFFDYYYKNTLYVAGTSFTTGAYQLATFKNKMFTDLTLSGATINYPAGIGSDSGLWIGDGGNASNSANIYQITISGTTATVVGTTPLTGATFCGQELAKRKVALCPSGGPAGIYFFKYPAGGDSYKSIGGFEAPYGLAISK